MTETFKVGRVLLPSIVVFERRDDGVIYATGKALPFILEELVALGISEVVVSDRWRYDEILPTLPRIYTKVLRFTDEREADVATVSKIFEPFFDEFRIETDKYLAGFRHFGGLSDDAKEQATIDAGLTACIKLLPFLTALREKSHCHFELDQMLKNLRQLAKGCRSPEMRANIAILKGVFTNYERTTHAALKTRVNSSISISDLFEELLDDAHYRALSHQVSLLGFRQKTFQIRRNITRLVKSLTQSRRGKQVFDYGSAAISLAASMPAPKSEMLEGFAHHSFLPPVVDISAAIRAARTRMRSTHSEIDFLGAKTAASKRTSKRNPK